MKADKKRTVILETADSFQVTASWPDRRSLSSSRAGRASRVPRDIGGEPRRDPPEKPAALGLSARERRTACLALIESPLAGHGTTNAAHPLHSNPEGVAELGRGRPNETHERKSTEARHSGPAAPRGDGSLGRRKDGARRVGLGFRMRRVPAPATVGRGGAPTRAHEVAAS